MFLPHQKFVRPSVTRIYGIETVYEGIQFVFSATTINQTTGRKNVELQRPATRWTPRNSKSGVKKELSIHLPAQAAPGVHSASCAMTLAAKIHLAYLTSYVETNDTQSEIG